MRRRQWWRGRVGRSGAAALSCRQVGRLLQSYLDGELDDLRRRRVANHLEDCRRCGLDADTYRAIKTSLARAAPELPAEPLDRLRSFAEDLAINPPDEQHPGA